MTGEPTLHYGDHSGDGWVTYAQGLLNELNAGPIESDGWFGDKTINAVYKFQQDQGLTVDGVIGDQTWAALRGDEPVDPHGDGHQHEQTDEGFHVVWDQAHEQVWDETNDRLSFNFVNVGNREIPPGQFFFNVAVNGGMHGFKHFELPMQPDVAMPPGGPLWATVENAKEELGTGEFTWTGELAPGVGEAQQQGAFTIE
jgi:hypothetical protein